MSNVLPKEILQAEWGRFRNRLLLVGALMFLGTAVLSGLALIPAHVAVHFEKQTEEQQSAKDYAALSETNKQAQSESGDVMRTQALLDAVTPIVSATNSPTDIIEAALAYRPASVRVDRITFIPGEKGTMVIDGISQGRESINQYKEALSQSGRFKSVAVPVGALVGTEGGKFIITLSGIF